MLCFSVINGVYTGFGIYLCFSSDGKRWKRLNRILAKYDNRKVLSDPHTFLTAFPVRSKAIVSQDKRFNYFYIHWTAKLNSISRYRIDRDRYMSIYTKKSGTFTTRSLIFDGRPLTLNATIDAGGQLEFQLETSEGLAVPGYSFADFDTLAGPTDFLDKPLTWKKQAQIPIEADKLSCKLRSAAIHVIYHMRPRKI
jgi:hypothetical protein